MFQLRSAGWIAHDQLLSQQWQVHNFMIKQAVKITTSTVVEQSLTTFITIFGCCFNKFHAWKKPVHLITT